MCLKTSSTTYFYSSECIGLAFAQSLPFQVKDTTILILRVHTYSTSSIFSFLCKYRNQKHLRQEYIMNRHKIQIRFSICLSGTLPEVYWLYRGVIEWERGGISAYRTLHLGDSQQLFPDPIILFLEWFSAHVLPFLMKEHLPFLTRSF